MIPEQLVLDSVKNPDMKRSGIYMIYCVLTKKAYIGQSTNMYRRMIEHRASFTNQQSTKNLNTNLQNDWITYGRNFFIFLVLEYCSQENLISRERYYIENINKDSLYNHINFWTGKKHSEDSKKRISFKNKGQKRPMNEERYRRMLENPLRAKLKKERVKDIKTGLLSGISIKDIAIENSVDCCTIHDIISGKAWKYLCHITGNIIYPNEDNFHLIYSGPKLASREEIKEVKKILLDHINDK